MATSDNRSRERMTVRHIPLVHGQSVGCHIYTQASGSRLERPCSLNLTHSISMPERENLPNEEINDFQCFTTKSSSNKRQGISDPGSENRTLYTSTTLHCNNMFVRKSPVHEENCDIYANSPHKYYDEYSFCQYGNSNGTNDKTLRYTTNPRSLSRCTVSTTGSTHKYQVLEYFEAVSEDNKVLSESGLHLHRDNEDIPVLMDCEEQDWADEKDYNGYVQKEGIFEDHEHYHVNNAFLDCDFFNRNQSDYMSDSSCNSSDGVLVNFSAIYNKTNNAVPATPCDLDSPANQSQGSGSMHQDADNFKLTPCWPACGLDPNCNIYQADSNDLSSQEMSDLTPCQGQLTTYTNNYYKLVTSDLSSQSAVSPEGSPLMSCSEAHSYGSMTPPSEYFLFRKPETENLGLFEVNQSNLKLEDDKELERSKRTRHIPKEISERKTGCKTCHVCHDKCKDPEPNGHDDTNATEVSRSWNDKPCIFLTKQEGLNCLLSCPSPISASSDVVKQRKPSFSELVHYNKSVRSPSMLENSKADPSCSGFSGNTSPLERNTPLVQSVTSVTSKTEKESGTSGSFEPTNIPTLDITESCLEGLNYTKPLRPTSLPILPFVLQPPTGTQSSKALGSLISHYMSHKHSVFKSSGLSSHLAHSTLDHSHLEVASCSDICSTCTPTPPEPRIRPHWAPPSPLCFQAHPDLKCNRTKLTEPNLREKNPGTNYICLHQTYPTLKPCLSGQERTSIKSYPHKQLHGFLPEQTDSHQIPQKCLEPQSRTQEKRVCSSSPTISSVIALTSDTSLVRPEAETSNSGVVHPDQVEEELSTSAARIYGAKKLPCLLVKEHHQHGDSSSLADRPPEEFCSSPDPYTKLLPIDLLQKKDMLKSLSLAVDLITAHFNSSGTDPNEKFRLGNSSLCPRISQLVLDQLCPAFWDILQDGLRPFKLDLIVGQRRNKPWAVVEASTQPGPSTRILHSLVSVVKKCSKLTNHSLRLNAFFLGLLNLSALESWFWHLHTCVDVIMEYYHPWAFLALSQDSMCTSLFQELLLLLQPLSELPFDLHLLSESRLQRNQEQNQPSIQQSRFLALSACSFLKTPNRRSNDSPLERPKMKEIRELFIPSHINRSNIDKMLQGYAVPASKQSTGEPEHKSDSYVSSKKKHAGWWLSQTPITERVMEADCSSPHIRNSHTLVENEDRDSDEFSVRTDEMKPPIGLCWTQLFGFGIGNPQRSIKQNQRIRLPSQWLQLGASKIDELAQSVLSKETSKAICQLQQRPKLMK